MPSSMAAQRMLVTACLAAPAWQPKIQVNPVPYPLVADMDWRSGVQQQTGKLACTPAPGSPCDEWPTQRQQNILRRAELGDG